MMTRQNLIFDADDTLWENNIYYEEVRERFLSLTDALGVSRTEVETRIDQTEQKNIGLYGYGSENFIRSLRETYAFFAGDRNHLQSTLRHIDSLGSALYDFRIELLPRVAETLAFLRERHRFFLLTKGNSSEQTSKVKKSNLQELFEAVVVVPEKNVATYERVAGDLALDKSITWMIGNSPRSDVNPALEAGLGAVYVPHAVTWHFEKVPVRTEFPRLIVVNQFADLLEHF
ncbi:MAG: HAD family hydrolase [Acidobacteriia bacterium]|nr:HAD family hydrolase [Terriglobia bacterium]